MLLPPFLPSFSCIAVGLQSGAVKLFRGNILRERKVVQQELCPPGPYSVTGIGYCEQPLSSVAPGDVGLTLLVATTAQVRSYRLPARGALPPPEELYSHGCENNCAVMSPEGIMMVGRAEGVFEIGVDGRRGCYAFEGERKLLFWFHNYLVEIQSTGASNKLNVYDVRNKFVAYSGTVGNVTQIVSEWSEIFVLTSDRKMLQLIEKDVQTKLEMLYKKGYYTLALNLANNDSKQFDANHRFDIYLKYGDYLYTVKHDYKGAMEQYINIIDRIEPSYVIRKYLDAQRIKNLTEFLEKLHEVKRANPDHTTLLLNCYIKLKDDDKLKKFVSDDQDFDVETAVKVCRQANYHNYASQLAKKHKEHDWYLKIQLEDLGHHVKALAYIRQLEFYAAEKNMKKYGKTLMKKAPEKTCQLLTDLCTDYRPTVSHAGEPGAREDKEGPVATEEQRSLKGGGNTKVKSRPQEFIHIFVDHPIELQNFLEYIVKHEPDCDVVVYNTLLELYLRDYNLVPNEREEEEPGGESSTSGLGMAGQSGAEYEAACQVAKEKNQEAALALLRNPGSKYDDDHALCLVQMFNFQPGMLYLYEKLKLYNEIVQHHMETNEYPAILGACKKFGHIDPNLWVQVLSYFALKDDAEEAGDCHKWIMDVLNNIEREKLLPPLLVVQILSQNDKTPLAVVKDYITRRLKEERTLIEGDQALINELRVETEQMRSDIHKLQTKAKVFSDTTCSVCQQRLDLPAVHFMCGHSFHQGCLVDNEQDCSVCAANNHKVMERKHALEKSVDSQEKFFAALTEGDGFQVVSEYFGRGLFNPPSAD